jgi:hypothetical protein
MTQEATKPSVKELVKSFMEAEIVVDADDKHLFTIHCGDVRVTKENPFQTYRELFSIAENRARGFGIEPGTAFSDYLKEPQKLPEHLNLPQPINVFAGRLKTGLYKVYALVTEKKISFSFYYFSRPDIASRPGPKQLEVTIKRTVKEKEPA